MAQGRSVGAGADLFVACRRWLVLTDATFRFPGSDFGVILGMGRLAARVGPVALNIIEAGKEIDADQAVELGLADRRVSPDQSSEALAEEIAAVSRLDATTHAQLRLAVAQDRGMTDRDLATLVRSVSARGLKARIECYRARQQKGRLPTTIPARGL